MTTEPQTTASSGNAGGLLQKILRNRVQNKAHGVAARRHTRHACSCLGTMSIINRSVAMEGIVSEISKGGLKFRPAKTYLQERKDAQVLFEFDRFRISGKIVATRSDGYGVALFEEIEDRDIEAFLAQFGSEVAANAA